MSETNVQTIRDVYAAFGRGDVNAILERVSENTQWGFNAGKDDVPWHQPVKNRDSLPGFFRAIAENVDMRVFEPRAFLHDGSRVWVELHLEYVVRRTGKRVEMKQMQAWTFGPDGKITGLVHYEDTAQVLAAWTS